MNETTVTTPSELEIRVERIFDAPRAHVFSVWTDPKLIPEWWGDGTVVEEMDVRSGGTYRFRTAYGLVEGEFREVDAPERLVQTFQNHLQTLEFEDLGDRTKLTQTMQLRDDRGARHDDAVRRRGRSEERLRARGRAAAAATARGVRCLSPASTTSPSRSTVSPPAKVRVSRHRSATPARGCTSGCSAPGGGARGSASPAAAAASTMPSPGSTVRGIGAEIMGAGKFGWPGWHEDPEWKGWWGHNPPFHTPVFVLTHHPRPPIEMEGGTTFHFLDASPAEALETAREAAGGQDVRLGGVPP